MNKKKLQNEQPVQMKDLYDQLKKLKFSMRSKIKPTQHDFAQLNRLKSQINYLKLNLLKKKTEKQNLKYFSRSATSTSGMMSGFWKPRGKFIPRKGMES